MKKVWAAVMAGMVLAAPGAAMAMDSGTLLLDPARYRVIFADADEVVYADMQTLQAMQSRDMPSSMEHFSFTMYVEKYMAKPGAMDFQQGRIVEGIGEYQARLLGFKAKDQYELEKTLTAVYDRDGKALDLSAWTADGLDAEADDMYYSLFLASRMKQTF